MSEQAVLQIQSDSRAMIATIMCPEFDFQNTNRFKTELASAKGGDGKLPLILDLSRVGFMPSLTLGVLVELRSSFARDQRRLTLVGVQPAIAKLFQIAGILSLFDVRGSVSEAMN